jgi:hypothetical protein
VVEVVPRRIARGPVLRLRASSPTTSSGSGSGARRAMPLTPYRASTVTFCAGLIGEVTTETTARGPLLSLLRPCNLTTVNQSATLFFSLLCSYRNHNLIPPACLPAHGFCPTAAASSEHHTRSTRQPEAYHRGALKPQIAGRIAAQRNSLELRAGARWSRSYCKPYEASAFRHAPPLPE